MHSMRFALTTAAVLLAGSAASAQQQEDKQEIQITGIAGWGSYVTRGDWTPALIDFDNRGRKDIALLVDVLWAAPGSNQSSATPALGSLYGKTGPVTVLAIPLPAKSRKRISLSLPTPDLIHSSIWVYARDAKDGRAVAVGELTTKPADPQKRVVGVVGTLRPEGLDDTVHLGNLQADELPETWQGYSSLEALVWLDGKASELRSAAQFDALKQWISAGGRLYVCRGNSINLTGTPIADLLPVKLGTGRELDSLGHNHFPDGKVFLLDSTLKKGLLRATVDGSPLVAEVARDAGRITFVAVDPTRPPFTDSPATKEFWTWLLQMGPPPVVMKLEAERAPGPVGSMALSQQAGRFPDVAAPEIGGLFLLIILYLVVVGPLDYFLLRWLQKLEYTWFTFPGYVLLFTLFILLVGGAFIQRAANQREIVVVDRFPDTGFVHRRALSAVLAPADVMYSVESAVPISSNFIEQRDTFGTGEKITDVTYLPDTPEIARNWLINRNFTALAVTDRLESSPSALSYALTGGDSVSVTLSVKNSTGSTIEGSTLVTSKGVYWISAIPAGETVVTGSRTASSPAEFVDKEGMRSAQKDRFTPYPADENPGGVGLSEKQLNPVVRKALIGALLPQAAKDNTAEVHTGFARSLQIQRWLESGGSVLLTWPAAKEAVVRYNPKPGRLTAVVLERYFQGPPP